MVEVVERPTLQSIAAQLLGPGTDTFPHDESSLRAAVIAETLRIALFNLYNGPYGKSPVHPLSLRSWVRHKLGPLIPNILEEGEGNFREVLSEGRSANLEFLGDALVLAGGYLCPAPTRLVQVGPSSCLLVSGVPSNALGTLTGRLVHSGLGRRIDVLTVDEIRALKVPLQTLDEYLGHPDGMPDPNLLIGGCLSRNRLPWQPGKDWEAYQGNHEVGRTRPEASYGFIWANTNDLRGRQFVQADFHGATVSIWREPLSDRFFHYWISARSGNTTAGFQLSNDEWKQACLAIDALAGRPRGATVTPDPRHQGVSLSLGFPPFEVLYRALHALGARFGGWRPGMAQWEIPVDARTHIVRILERVGVRVRVLGG